MRYIVVEERGIVMKKKIIGIAVAVLIVLGALPFAVIAAGSGEGAQAISLGIGGISGYNAENGYDYIYYGNFNGGPVKWRVLDNKTNTGVDGLLLLSEVLFGRTATGGIFFNGNENGTNEWQTSSTRYWCVNEFKAFTDAEYRAIMETYKSDAEYYGAPAVNNILNGDKVFFLSKEEVFNKREYGFGIGSSESRKAYHNGTAKAWLLRSPGNENDYVEAVMDDGFLAEVKINRNSTARPAFNLTPDGVLFSSPAAGGKADGGLAAVGKYKGNEFKLTLLDGARGSFSVMPEKRIGNTVRFTYSGAVTGSNEYISAMIINNGTVTHYGHIKNLPAVSYSEGFALLTLPENFDPDNGDKLYVFNEQLNGDYATDYAGPLRELNDVDGTQMMLRLKIGTDNLWYVSYDGGVTWSSLGVKATGDKGDKGDKGEKGDKGDSGDKGERGDRGTDGNTPQLKIGDDNLWYVSYDGGNVWISMNIRATGEKGERGEAGQDGKDGSIPYIGSDGNWWVGETNTGVKASVKGEKGDTGAQGADGENGSAPQLKIGADNIWYVSYDKGASWISLGVKATGEKGAKGDKGDKGDAGSDGTDGLTPFIGENGNWWIGEKDTGVKAVAALSASGDSAGSERTSVDRTLTYSAVIAAGLAVLISIASIIIIVIIMKKRNSRNGKI